LDKEFPEGQRGKTSKGGASDWEQSQGDLPVGPVKKTSGQKKKKLPPVFLEASHGEGKWGKLRRGGGEERLGNVTGRLRVEWEGSVLAGVGLERQREKEIEAKRPDSTGRVKDLESDKSWAREVKTS